MSLDVNPESSRWFAKAKGEFINEYGISFWRDMVKELYKADEISDLPKEYQIAYAKISGKLGHGFSSSEN